MIDAMQLTWLAVVGGVLVGLGLAAWIDTRIVQPWRRRRHDRR